MSLKKGRTIRLVDSAVALPLERLKKFPEELHKVVIYGKFMRLKKFVSRREFYQNYYKSYIKRTVKAGDVPKLLETLKFIQLAVSENPRTGGDPSEQIIAKKILDNIISLERSKDVFFAKKSNQKYSPLLHSKEYEGHDVFRVMKHYEQVVGYLNKSLGTCL